MGRAFEQGMSLRLIANNDSSLGRNYVSFPYTSSLPSAAALVRTFPYRLYEPSLTLLNRSNTSQEYWQPHAWGSKSYNNFTLETGKGYLAYVDTTTVINLDNVDNG